MLKTYSIRPIGDKKLGIRREDKKLSIEYFSPEAFARVEQNEVIGYTDLKEKPKRKQQATAALVSNTHWISAVYDEKTAHKSVKGYICVGNYEFIAIERSSPLWLLLLLLLFAVLLLCFSFCGRSDTPADADAAEPWVPTIDQHIGETSTKAASSVPQIKIAGFSDWYVPEGQTEDLPITLKNPDGNPCYFSFAIILTDTGETIYKSDMVPPGESIRQVTISKPLSAGTYQAVVHITTNELTTGQSMNDAKLNLTITVS